MGSSSSSCIFCDIVSENDVNKIHFSNEKVVIFSDIKPASKHHYLVIPREHIKDAKELTAEHVDLVQEMHRAGAEYLGSICGEKALEDCKFGFHLPPFISVQHLHLHVIYPYSEVGMVGSMIFPENRWYFVSPECVIKQIQAETADEKS